jgi:hypothetical protein
MESTSTSPYVAVQVDVLDNVKVYLNGPDRASSLFHAL